MTSTPTSTETPINTPTSTPTNTPTPTPKPCFNCTIDVKVVEGKAGVTITDTVAAWGSTQIPQQQHGEGQHTLNYVYTKFNVDGQSRSVKFVGADSQVYRVPITWNTELGRG
jgi:hypothetical protein